MKFEDDIDKLFKDKLSNREFEIKDSYIADLESSLDNRKSGWNRIGIILFSLFLLIGISSAGYFMFNSDNNVIAGQLETPNEIVNNNINSSGAISTTNLNASKSSEQENIAKEITLGVAEENINHTSSNESNNYIITNEINKKINSPKKTNTSNTNKSKEKEGSKSLTIASANINNSSNNTIKNSNLEKIAIADETNNLSSYDQSFDNEMVSKNINQEADPIVFVDSKESVGNDSNKQTNRANVISPDGINATNLGNIESPTTLSKTTDSIEVNGLLAPSKIESKEKFEFQNTNNPSSLDSCLKKNSLENVERIIEAEDSIETNPIISPIVNPALKDVAAYEKWSISVFGGPTPITKTIEGTNLESYITQRENEESEITTFSYGVSIGYYFNKNINLSSGLYSMTYGEDVNYDISSISFAAPTVTWDSINGWDTIQNPMSSLNSYNNQNRYQYLHIPLMIGYKFNVKKLGVNLKFGGSFAFLIKEKGLYINTELTAVEPASMKKTIVNAIASTVVSYPIKKAHLLIEPKYQFQSSSFFNDSEIKQPYSSFGINFGIKLKF